MGSGFLKNLWPNYPCTQTCKSLPFEMDQSIWKRTNTMCPPNNICGLHVDDLSLLLYLFKAFQNNNVLIAIVHSWGSTLKAKLMGSTTSLTITDLTTQGRSQAFVRVHDSHLRLQSIALRTRKMPVPWWRSWRYFSTLAEKKWKVGNGWKWHHSGFF